jgi:glc operon protein GlcG
MYQSDNLSYTDALKIITVIQAELEKEQKGAAIAVSDAHGELIAFLRTDGCRLSAITVAINKAFTAAREKKESKAVGQDSKDEEFPMTNFGELRYVTWGGGVPVIHNGKVIGAVGVSGLPEAKDMVLAQMGAAVIS